MKKWNLLSYKSKLQKIADILLLNGLLIDCPGLIHGKMGIEVFLFHYAKYTDNVLFDDYAFDMIVEMQKQIHENSPADYERGIAGIGVGLDYLIRNHFFEADDDFFEDFDKRMYRAVMYDPWQDLSLYNGLVGYGRYWMTRFSQQDLSIQARECLMRIAELIEEKIQNISAKEQTEVYYFLLDLQKISGFDFCTDLLMKCQEQTTNDFSRLGYSVTANMVRMYYQKHYYNSEQSPKNHVALKYIPDLDLEKPTVSMGLLSGYAGEGLMRLTALNKANMSWIYLL